MDMRVTYKEFMTGVHAALRGHQIEATTFTPAVKELLAQIKPRLLKNALEHVDPEKPPYDVHGFITYLEKNWTAFDRQTKEFSHPNS